MLGITPLDLGVIVTALLVGAVVQSVVGLGLGLVAAPVVTLVEPSVMPELMLWLAVAMPLVTLAGEREDIDWRGLAWAFPPRAVGTVGRRPRRRRRRTGCSASPSASWCWRPC